MFTLGGHAVVWISVKQFIIVRSTMESEFIALELVGSEAEWLPNLLANIPLGIKPPTSVLLHCDCQSTIAMAKNKSSNGKNRHIQLRHNSKATVKRWNNFDRLCEVISHLSWPSDKALGEERNLWHIDENVA